MRVDAANAISALHVHVAVLRALPVPETVGLGEPLQVLGALVRALPNDVAAVVGHGHREGHVHLVTGTVVDDPVFVQSARISVLRGRSGVRSALQGE